MLQKNGTSFATVIVMSPMKLNKKDGDKNPNPFDVVFKQSKLNGVLGYDYEHSVNLQRGREGRDTDFQAERRPWGTRINKYLVEHNGNWYLTLKIERTLGDVTYWHNGRELEKDAVAPFMGAKSESSRQGVETTVVHRDIMLSSIVEISIDKNTYTLTD
jgi:hypothetical protein